MKYFIYFFALLFLASCSKPEESYVKIPSEFFISVQEEIKSGNGSRQLWLEFSSMNQEYCQEDSLVYNISTDSISFGIDIVDSYKANDCFPKNSYLKSRIKLPSFFDSLPVRLNLGSSLIQFSIINNKNDYEIEIDNGIGLIKKYERTYKIPFNLLWGYAYQKSPGYDGTIQMSKFIDEIRFDCSTSWLPKGYYTYFTIQEKNTLVLNDNPGFAGSYMNFYFTHYKTEDELNQFFIDLASKYVNLVGYKIYSGSGKEFIAN